MEIDAALDLVSRRGWLSQTPRAFRNALLARVHLQTFTDGEIIYEAGDRPEGSTGSSPVPSAYLLSLRSVVQFSRTISELEVGSVRLRHFQDSLEWQVILRPGKQNFFTCQSKA